MPTLCMSKIFGSLNISKPLVFCHTFDYAIFIESFIGCLLNDYIHYFLEVFFSSFLSSLMNSSWFSLLFQFFSLALVLTHDVLNWVRFILVLDIIVILIAGIFFNSLWIFNQFLLNHFRQKFYRKYFFVCEWNFDSEFLYLFVSESLSLS